MSVVLDPSVVGLWYKLMVNHRLKCRLMNYLQLGLLGAEKTKVTAHTVNSSPLKLPLYGTRPKKLRERWI